MAMVYTLVTSAKEWLSGRFGQDGDVEDAADDEMAKDEVRTPSLVQPFDFLLMLLVILLSFSLEI